MAGDAQRSEAGLKKKLAAGKAKSPAPTGLYEIEIRGWASTVLHQSTPYSGYYSFLCEDGNSCNLFPVYVFIFYATYFLPPNHFVSTFKSNE